jgi:hypothetical protein
MNDECQTSPKEDGQPGIPPMGGCANATVLQLCCNVAPANIIY